MKNINLNPGIWNNYTKNILKDEDTLNKENIKNFINDFWQDVMLKLNSNKLVYLLLKANFKDGSQISITYMEKLNLLQQDKFIEQCYVGLENKFEEYANKKVDELFITYQIIPESLLFDLSKEKPRRTTKKIPSIAFSGFNLPITMDLSIWGHEIERTLSYVLIQKNDSQLLYKITFEDANTHKVEIIRRGEVIFNFIDKKENNDPLNTFVRTLKFQKHFFKKGKLVSKIVKRKIPFL